jgi:hypothetical protein
MHCTRERLALTLQILPLTLQRLYNAFSEWTKPNKKGYLPPTRRGTVVQDTVDATALGGSPTCSLKTLLKVERRS